MSQTKKLRVTLEIDVTALEGEELDESGFFEDLDELARNSIEDYDAAEVADVIESDDPSLWVEAFAGTGLYVKFDKVTVVSAEWAK